MRARGQRVRNWRVVTAIAAVVLAALAGVLVWKYTDDAKEEAKEPYTFTKVLVAKTRVPVNTSFERALEAGMIAREDRVQDSIPASHIAGKPEDGALVGKLGALVASHDITEGQTIVAEDFVKSGSVSSSLGGQLESDQGKDKDKQLMALSVQLDEPRAVAGFLVPGDTVNVVISGEIGSLENPGGTKVKTTAFLLPGIKVLAVGQTTAKPAASTSSSSSTDGTTPTTTRAEDRNRSLITLEVTARQAEQIIHAQEVGKITLALNPSSFKASDFKSVEEIVEVINLFDQPLPVVDRALAAAKAAEGQ
jgi:Flp pilus assembly protein CpaB